MTEKLSMTERTRRERKRRLSIRLDTLMLIMTLVAIVVAIFVADKNLVAWQQRLSRLETALGLPRVRDIRNIEVATMHKEQGWSIWVPSGRTAKVCFATEDLDSSSPPIEGEFLFKTGRNIVKLPKPSGTSSATILLNSEPIFTRDFSRLWNINSNISAGYDFATVRNRTELFKSFSNVRLKVDEPFDPVKHRCGLRIWIEP